MKIDSQLQRDVLDQLEWEPSIREADIGAAVQEGVHDGNITLSGTVRSYAERRDAERAAWGAPGVTNVDDRIAVTMCADATPTI